MNHRLIRIVVICVLILMATPVVVTAADFDVTTEESINVADRSVEQSGNTYEINSITQVDPNGQITANVDAPSGTDVTMYLYDKNENILRGYEGTGPTNFNVDIANHGASEPGTYALVVQSDGVREAAHPLVVQGYSISANAPGSATMGNDISVDGEFTQLRGDQYDQIDIVMAATDTETELITQPDIDGETFSTSVSTQNTELEPGSYDVYAVVRGSDTALGRQEILGVSSPQLLEIEADEGENSDDDDGSDDGDGGGGGSTAPADTTEEETEETTEDTPEQASLNDGPVSRTVTDNNPDQDGVNVPVNAGPVGEVAFESSESDASGEITVSKSSTTTETFSSQFGSDRVKTAVSITVPDSLSSTTATVEFRLSEEELGGTAPANLQAVKNTDGGSQVLSSTAEESSDGGAVVTARTPGFSEFAVITAPTESDSTTTQNDTTNGDTGETDEADSTTETDETDTTQSDSTDDGAPGFGLVVAFVALVVTALVGIRR